MTLIPGAADRGVALLTDDPEIQTAVSRAAGTLARPVPVSTFPAASVGAAWSAFEAIMLGPDAVAGARAFVGTRIGPSRLAVVCAAGRPSSGSWLPDVPVLTLPQDGADMVSWLGLAAPAAAGVVAVVGGRGGAGASTAAVALAHAAVRRSGGAVLVDADPLGGGLDLALGAEAVAGARWPELAELGGAVAARWLVAALPKAHGIAVVSHARTYSVSAGHAWGGHLQGDVGADSVAAVLDACLPQLATIVDLARHDGPVTRAALSRCSTLVVVVPAEVRACAAAAALVDRLADGVPDVRLLIRGPSPAGLDAEDVAEAVGVPTFAQVRAEPGLTAAVERGDPIAVSARSPLRQWADAMSATATTRSR